MRYTAIAAEGTTSARRLRAWLGHRVRRRLRIEALQAQVVELQERWDRDLSNAWSHLEGHEERLARTERLVRMTTVMAWIEQATLSADPLVSVIIPTRDRTAFLERAIESVLEQSYSNWELVVSDDSSSDGAEELLARHADPRMTYVRGGPSSASAARNRGLDRATGELITYLDDDNRMHPNWLKSVAWAFEQRPDAEILYGGIAIDDPARLHREAGSEMPSAFLESYDREAVVDNNVADSSAIAHRSSLSGARFDESLSTMADWDFLLRMTTDRDPLTLPAIACFYYTDAADRLSDRRAEHERDLARIRQRARALRRAG